MVLELSHILRVPKAKINRFLNESGHDSKFSERIKVLKDQFELLSSWYHFAILELVQLKTFEPDGKWISTKLGISVTEANIAVDRLIRYEFVKVESEV
jgi:hypothetical protein